MIGILLLNLGTPDAPTESAVRAYLNEFLSDPYVIALPAVMRDFLVQKIILPRRPKKTAHAYQQIWTDLGSPLLTNSVALQNALQQQLFSDYAVALGMRYGNPSIENAIAQLQKSHCDKVIVLPLFPQYCRATTQSAIDNAMHAFQRLHYSPTIHIINEFYQEDFYLDSVARLIQAALAKHSTDFLLLSYHGLPERQIEPTRNYQTHCLETSALIAQRLVLSDTKYSTTFQSRLGFAQWIGPYTDQMIKTLRHKGAKTLSVACPSFIADCLETLEEINIRLRAQWLALGGEDFQFIPCLNADEEWVEALVRWLRS